LIELVGEKHTMAGDGVSAYTVDGKVPEAVVFPASVEEVSAIMTLASAEGLRVVPRGSGTKITLGAVPDGVDLVLGLSRLNALITHEPGDMTATFQAGILLSEAQELLGRSGQFIALDPPYTDRATLGGVLATNSSGPRRLRYGSARDLLIAIRVVQADGKIIKGGAKVVKSVSGYDMNKLFIGALGTLGIIVEATFRLYPVPKVEKTYLIPFPSVDDASEVVARILDSSLVPSAVELLCPVASSQVVAEVALPWPKDHYGLAVAIGSVSPEAVNAQLEVLVRISKHGSAHEGTRLEGQVHDTFWRATRDISMGDHFQAVLKASVTLTKVAEAVRLGEKVAARLGLGLAVVSEAGSGIIRYHLADQGDSPRGVLAPVETFQLGRAATPQGEPHGFQQGVVEAVKQLRTFAQDCGGSLVVMEAWPEVKGNVDVWGSVGSALPLMQGLKKQFDPQRILNPGRFVGGI
jgi:glycolate oxidase FAD binding subunit